VLNEFILVASTYFVFVLLLNEKSELVVPATSLSGNHDIHVGRKLNRNILSE
jgi:hypothetical protein